MNEVYILCLFLFVFFLACPWKKWFLVIVIFFGVVLCIVWSKYFFDISRPTYGGAGGALGLVMMFFVTISFVLALVLRLVVFIYKESRKLPNEIDTYSLEE